MNASELIQNKRIERAMIILLVIAIGFLLIGLLNSCGAPKNTEQASTVKWGKLSGNDPTFIKAKTLLICGAQRNDNLLQIANNSVWEWNYARGVYHRAFQAWDCSYRADYQASVKVAFGYCEKYVVGYHTQNGNHHDITICNGVHPKYWQQIMTHEVGHAYGLCDQYAPANAGRIVFHPNCGWPRSSQPARSIMGGLYEGSPTGLTADDIAGVRYLQTHQN